VRGTIAKRNIRALSRMKNFQK